MHDFDAHEIPCPDHRAIRAFLWFNSFHDAQLLRVTHGQPDRQDVTLTLRCEGASSFSGTYHLRFHRVKHFEHVGEDAFGAMGMVFSCNLLDTPLRRRCAAEAKHELYHLRIRLVGAELIDIVFRDFSIRKEGGRADYRRIRDMTGGYDYHASVAAFGNSIREEYAGKPEAELLPWEACLMTYHRFLLAIGAEDVPAIVRLARQLLTQPMAVWHREAAYQLGYYGDASDLPMLMRLRIDPRCSPADKQEAQDAMERIMERSVAHA